MPDGDLRYIANSKPVDRVNDGNKQLLRDLNMQPESKVVAAIRQ